MPVFLFFFLFVVFVLVKSSKSPGRVARAWARSALELGGTNNDGGPQGSQRITGEWGEHSYSVSVYRKRVNRTWRKGTRYEVRSEPLPFAFIMRRMEDVMLDRGSAEPTTLVPADLGDPYFDTRFHVLTDNPAAAKEYFDLQRRRQIDHHLGEMNGMLLTQRLLQYDRGVVESSAERLTATVESMLAIAESLRQPSRSDIGAAEPRVKAARTESPFAGIDPEPRVQEFEAPPRPAPGSPAPELPSDLIPLDPAEIDFSELTEASQTAIQEGLSEKRRQLLEALQATSLQPPAELLAAPLAAPLVLAAGQDKQQEPELHTPVQQEKAPGAEAPMEELAPAEEPEMDPPADLPSQRAEPTEQAPENSPPAHAFSIEPHDLFADLFVEGRMGIDIEQDFAANYAGGGLEGEGTLVRIDDLSLASRLARRGERRAYVEVSAPNAAPHERPIVVLLSVPADWPALSPGEDPPKVRFRGRLESCEPYLRQVSLEDGDLQAAGQ